MKGHEGFLVINAVENILPCSFYLHDDCYEDIMQECPGFREVMQNLVAEDITLNGRLHAVQSLMGRDLKLPTDGWGDMSAHRNTRALTPRQD
jgi:hypothetical protein